MKVLALASLLLGGCWITCIGERPRRHMQAKPDLVCRTGSVAGFSVYSWNCAEGRHVVHYYFSGELACGRLQQESSPCGQLTHFEEENRAALAQCRPLPERDW
jgi:hypothetical protein